MIKIKYLKDRSIVKIKKDNYLECEGRVRLSKIKMTGYGNKIIIKKGARISESQIYIRGNNNLIIINEKCDLNKLIIDMENKGGIIEIGKNTTCAGLFIGSLEPFLIKIGEDCMISYNVEIRNTDSHKMLDIKTNKWINRGKEVVIGNKVWIAARATVLKGVKIGNGCIVGAGSILTNKYKDNTLIVGIPGKEIRKGVTWNREDVFREY